MKHISLFCLLLLGSLACSAQAYDSAARYHLSSPSFGQAMDYFIHQAATDPTLTGEASRPSMLERKKLWAGSRISHDVAIGADIATPMSAALAGYMVHYNDYCPGSGYTGNWKCLGPFNDYYNVTADYPGNCENQGRVDAIWVPPIPDTLTMLAGSNGGGLWKTNDGGRNWRCLTDGAMGTASSVIGIGGVHSIAVNPADTNKIYIAVGGPDQAKKTYQYGLGLAYTLDGGATWATDNTFNAMVSSTHIARVTKVAYMPGTQQLFAISEDKILYKASPAHAWTNITPDTIAAGGYWCSDLEFSKATPGTAVVSTTALNGTSSLWCYNSGSWTRLIVSLPSPYVQESWQDGHTFSDGVKMFSISGEDNAYLWVAARNGGAKASLFLKTPLTSYSPTMLNYNFPGTTPSDITDFEVSGNHNIIYATNYFRFGAGTDNYPASLVRSVNEGATFKPFKSTGHPDGRCVVIQHSLSADTGLYDVVYFGNDGGIRKKGEGRMYCHSITGKNLGISQFFGFGNTEADDGLMIAGGQDIGTHAYRKTQPDPWQWVAPGDGYTAKFAVNGVKKAFGEKNSTTGLHPMFGINFSPIGILSFSVATPTDSAISNINRPQYFDPQNTAHVGYSYIWKKHYNTGTGDWGFGSWQRAFQSDPIWYGLPIPYYKIVVDFHIGESDTNNVYIAYRDITVDSAGIVRNPLNDTFGKLYHSINAGDVITPPTWVNITPSICTKNGINTIMVDPNNPARIWVGFGNINDGYVGASPDTMKRRVWYSSNYGATWSEASKGLSALPVNKLLYRKGTDDEMYAGTDAGVFKWNKAAAQWECFNNGLPPCTVMDMEFNYCAGKLRIATFGRGIWETPLPAIDPANEEPIEITAGTTTWSTERWLQTGVRIKTGGVLKINGTTIHMPADKLIIVEQGGKLEVQSSTLTNSCENCMWGGIQAWGGTGAQTAATKGWVTIRNSTIEHAVIGVGNYREYSSPTYYQGGGVIQAVNSTFRNNRTSVSFQEYHNGTSAGVTPDLSYFYNCTFKNENGFKYVPYAPLPKTLVSMCGVEGIRYKGCFFADDRTAYGGQFLDGIQATNSGFSVETYLQPVSTTWTRCRFHGLQNGILTREAGIDVMHAGTVTIDQADFDTLSVGVNVIAQDVVSVTRCKFNVGCGINNPFVENSNGLPASCGRNIGILTQSAKLFRIEGNTFSGVTNYFSISPWYNIGVLTVDAGNKTNRIYRNSFDHLTYGVMGLGKYSFGSVDPPGYALQVSCNTFNTNTNDIYSGGTHDYEGIGKEQYMINTTYSSIESASNSFSGSTKNVVNINATRPLKYYFGGSTATTSGTVTLISAGNHACPTTLPGDLPGSSTSLPSYMTATTTSLDKVTLAGYKSAFYSAKSAHVSALANRTSIIDAGKTDSVITLIDTSSNMQLLFQSLSSLSPFLSREALMEAAVVHGQNNYQDVVDLLDQNPEVISDYEYLDDIADVLSMTSQDFDALWATACSTQTQRSAIEQNISKAKAGMDENGLKVLFALRSPIDTNISVTDTTYAGICMDSTSIYYLLDSNSVYPRLDTLDVWLANIGGYKETYERVGLKYFLGQDQDANTLFSSISTLAMTPSELSDYNGYGAIWNVLYSAAQNGRRVSQLNASDISALGSIPAYPDLLASRSLIFKTNIPLTTTISNYPCTASPPAAKTTRRSIRNRDKEGSSYQLSAYPNPASGTVIFSFVRPDNIPETGAVTITVSNLLGEKIVELPCVGTSGQVNWQPASSVASGVYIYQASDNKGVFGKGKIVLVK